MRTNQADLFGSRSGPLRSGLAHLKAPYGDVVSTWLIGIETCWPDIDFNELLIGIEIIEIRPYICVLIIALAIPVFFAGLVDLVERNVFEERVCRFRLNFSCVVVSSSWVKPVTA